MAGAAEGAEARACFVDNLRWAVAEVPSQSLTIEPINRDDMPGYFLCNFDEGKAIVEEVNAPNLRLQFDAYHAQKITGDVFGIWGRIRDVVVHVQVGQTPHRTAPDQGYIDFDAFFRAVEKGRLQWLDQRRIHPR